MLGTRGAENVGEEVGLDGVGALEKEVVSVSAVLESDAAEDEAEEASPAAASSPEQRVTVSDASCWQACIPYASSVEKR